MYNVNNNNVDVLIHANNVDSTAYDQIKLIKKHPSFRGLIAIMPDVHAGAGCVIGFTGKFADSIIPNIVGVDIGCGVLSYKLPDSNLSLSEIDSFIRDNIPTGFNSNKTMRKMDVEDRHIIDRCEELVKTKKLNANPSLQAGTLGGGNHFIEIEQSETTGDRYLTVHSGSRKFGLEVAMYYQRKAKKLVKDMNISVPKDLEYLPMNLGGDDYIIDMFIAQRYAQINRYLMIYSILEFMGIIPEPYKFTESIHNYISPRDNKVRKGAISAFKNEKVVIPLNMGKDGGIVIGTGKGNTAYNNSAPHGAGRVYGRKVMKRMLKSGELTMEAFEDSMEGVFSSSVCEGTIDESPSAYKGLESIREHLEETVEIEDIARPILSFKDVK